MVQTMTPSASHPSRLLAALALAGGASRISDLRGRAIALGAYGVPVPRVLFMWREAIYGVGYDRRICQVSPAPDRATAPGIPPAPASCHGLDSAPPPDIVPPAPLVPDSASACVEPSN